MLGRRQCQEATDARFMDLDNYEHQEKVKSFSKEWYEKLDKKAEGRNPIYFFPCCLAFCSRNYPGAATHNQNVKYTFKEFKRVTKIENGKELSAALFKILEKRKKDGQLLVLPSFNHEHVEDPNDTEEVQNLKRTLKEKCHKIIHLEHEVQKKNDELEKLKRQVEELSQRNEKTSQLLLNEEEDRLMLRDRVLMCQLACSGCKKCDPLIKDVITEEDMNWRFMQPKRVKNISNSNNL